MSKLSAVPPPPPPSAKETTQLCVKVRTRATDLQIERPKRQPPDNSASSDHQVSIDFILLEIRHRCKQAQTNTMVLSPYGARNN